MRHLLMIGLLAVTACGKTKEAPVATTAPPAATITPPAAQDAPPPTPTPEGPTVITISKTGVLVGDQGEILVSLPAQQERGFEAKHKRDPNGLLIVPLAERLERSRETDAKRAGDDGSSEAIIIAHGDTAYRILAEVLFTLGQSGFGRYHLMEENAEGASPDTKRDPDQPLAFPAPGKAPALATPDDPTARALHLTAIVGPKGIALKTSSGNISPGCEAVGPGVAVPMVEGDHDLTELARCAARLKREAPSEKTVTISAEPNVSYRVILGVMAALRGGEEDPLFSNVQFGILR